MFHPPILFLYLALPPGWTRQVTMGSFCFEGQKAGEGQSWILGEQRLNQLLCAVF